MGFSVSNSSISFHSGSQFSGGSRGQIESDLNRLKKQRDDYEKQSYLAPASGIDSKIASLEKRIENLQQRLDKYKEEEKAEQQNEECETCANRRYQDGSDDPGVSFKMAGKIDPSSAESVVRGHEYEHVYRNQAKAAREDKEIVYQNVVIKHGICPECGDPYVAGGETTTVTKTKSDERFSVGMKDNESGKLLNVAV